MKWKNHNKRSTRFVEKWERYSMTPICETFAIDINVDLDRHSKERNFSLSLPIVHKRRDRRCLKVLFDGYEHSQQKIRSKFYPNCN
uniref:Uncharacterized protein n=1 Tax=Cucumis melo TaxID=3656 RepID=A0A9I9E9T7_CUCME